MRASGILMHITSLPSPYGIGTFGREAEAFIDWLKSAGQTYWQVLPLSPTGYGDSPYQSFSTFAGNPLLIDLDDLVANGMLTKERCEETDFGADPRFVDYEKVSKTKLGLLREAFASFSEDVGYLAFVQEEAFWLDDYALFMALKEKNGQKIWTTLDKPLRHRDTAALEAAREENLDEIKFHKFVQYTFMRQWQKLRRYANKNGIKIIGDLPIYVALDSSDVWANPELFMLDIDLNPTKVAGVPPDYFSATGQLWGNPLYHWKHMKSEKYLWWIDRIRKALELYDYVRIDHFRAFDTYWAIPADAKDAVGGAWEKGPGIDFFNTVKAELGDVNIIAEDLGEKFDSVVELLNESGFPGMRVLQFGFNPENHDNDHLPHNYPKNSIAYTGTHDNSTFKGWYQAADRSTKRMAQRYLNRKPFESICKAAIRACYASNADFAILPMQDVLMLDDNSRMNIPSTLGGNWIWRIRKGAYKDKHAKLLAELCRVYFR